jgi:hypothetical protein
MTTTIIQVIDAACSKTVTIKLFYFGWLCKYMFGCDLYVCLPTQPDPVWSLLSYLKVTRGNLRLITQLFWCLDFE